MKIPIKQIFAFYFIAFIAFFGWVLNPTSLNASDFNAAVSELLETVQKDSDYGPKRLSIIPEGSNKNGADQLFIDVTGDINSQYGLSYSPNEIMAYICGMNSVNLSAINALGCIPNFYLGCYSEEELLRIARGVIDLYSQFNKVSADLKVKLDKILADGGEIKLFKLKPNAYYLRRDDRYIKNYVSLLRKESQECYVSVIFNPVFCDTWGLTVSGENEDKELTFNGATAVNWAGRLKSYVRKNIISKMLGVEKFSDLKLRLREQNLTKLIAKIPPKASDPILFNGAESDADISVLELLRESNWDSSEVKRPIHTVGGADIGNLSAASYFSYDLSDTGEFDYGSVVAASSATQKAFHTYIANSPNRLCVLDIGGNNGVNILRHVPKHNVVLCDLNPNALHMAYAFARKYMPTHLDNLSLSLNKAQDLVLEDCSLDVIMLGYLLKYLMGSEIDALFHNICKWLKPGGRIYILEITSDNTFYKRFIKDPDLIANVNWPGQLGKKKKLSDGSVVEAKYFLNKVRIDDIKQSLLRSGLSVVASDMEYNGLYSVIGIVAQKESVQLHYQG